MKTITRVSAGLAVLGLAGAALTGCGGKDPDDALCDEVKSAMEDAGLSSSSDVQKLLTDDPDKSAELGKKISSSAEENDDAKYADVANVLGDVFELTPKALKDPTDQDNLKELEELQTKLNDKDMNKKLKEWDKECNIPFEG